MITEYEQILDLIENIKAVQDMLGSSKGIDETNYQYVNDIFDAIRTINKCLFESSKIANTNTLDMAPKVLVGEITIKEFIQSVSDWIDLIITTINEFSSYRNEVDMQFYKLMKYVEVTNIDIMMENTLSILNQMRVELPDWYTKYRDYYTFYTDFWGGLNLDNNEYGVVTQRVTALHEHREDFSWLYHNLGDYRSKKTLYHILKNWITFDYTLLTEAKEHCFGEYYDFDLIPQTDEEEVLVDLGAYIGDSAEAFIKAYSNHYKKIYCYEITPDTFFKLKNTLEPYKNVICKQKGVGSTSGKMYLKKFGVTGSSNQVSQEGEIELDVVAIDEDITEKITFIKMDIEGAEQEALPGCRRHILEEKPKLTISTYHNNEDIWKIPRMVKEMNPEYKLYMRYNGKQIGPSEFTLFAL
ncbi:MAG TPA: FkbM family methyltransferase [Lachnospiraceae bacterium]|nr:FkbM family methyltransferase [Lachnospiraceae bacterium]